MRTIMMFILSVILIIAFSVPAKAQDKVKEMAIKECEMCDREARDQWLEKMERVQENIRKGRGYVSGRYIVSTDVWLDLLGIYNANVEIPVTSGSNVLLGGGYGSFAHEKFYLADIGWRYYPGHTPPRGGYVGIGLKWLKVEHDVFSTTVSGKEEKTGTSSITAWIPMVEAGYRWILFERLGIGIGIQAGYGMANAKYETQDVSVSIPLESGFPFIWVPLTIGFAF